jgi:hypothetical protein
MKSVGKTNRGCLTTDEVSTAEAKVRTLPLQANHTFILQRSELQFWLSHLRQKRTNSELSLALAGRTIS